MQRQRRYEFFCGVRHNDKYSCAKFSETADNLARFVSGNSAGNSDNNCFIVQHGFSPFCALSPVPPDFAVLFQSAGRRKMRRESICKRMQHRNSSRKNLKPTAVSACIRQLKKRLYSQQKILNARFTVNKEASYKNFLWRDV